MNRNLPRLIGATFLILHGGVSSAFDCVDLKPGEVFVTETLRTDENFTRAMKQYACSQGQFTDRDATRIGLNLPLAEGVLGFKFGQDSFSSWKQQHCQGASVSESGAAYLSNIRNFADPNKLQLLLACKKLEADLQATGLQCSLKLPDQNSPLHTMLNITWRAASDSDSRPTVQAVHMGGVSCDQSVVNQSIPTGGLRNICTRASQFKASTIIVRASNGQSCDYTIPAALTVEQREKLLMTRWEEKLESLSKTELAAVRCLLGRQSLAADLQVAREVQIVWETCDRYAREGKNNEAHSCFRSAKPFNAKPPAQVAELHATITQAVSESKSRVKQIEQAVANPNPRCLQ